MTAPAVAALQRYSPPPSTATAERFPVSCGAEAGAAVERGVALLHTQSCDAARREFDAAADADPDCAMAHWGQAMSLACLPAMAMAPEARARARQALDRGRHGREVTPRERAYLDAAEALLEGPAARATLSLDHFAAAMASLERNAPDDRHSTVFQAWSVLSRSTVQGDLAQRQAASVVAARFGDAPEFGPAALALLMSRDNPADAAAGRAAAEAYSKAAPQVPHALHRPAHVFTRLGEWDAAVAAGERALEAAGIGASPELFHTVPTGCFAPEWLHYAYVQQGRFERARWVAERVTHGIEYGGEDVAVFAKERELRLRVRDLRARLAMASWDWNARFESSSALAAATRSRATLPDADLSALTAIELLEHGLAAARAAWPGARPEAVAAAHRIASVLEARAARPARREAELFQALVQTAIAAAQEERDLMALWIAQAESRERQMVEAGELPLPVIPVQELAGDLWLQVHRYADARDAFRAALAKFPGRGRSHLGLARALDKAGERGAGRRAWEAFYAVWSLADPERPEMAEARAALGRLP